MVRGGGFEPEKKLERNSFANDNENSAMQMGEGGEQNWSRNMYVKGSILLVREKGSHIPGFQYFHTFVESLDMTFDVAGSENRRLVTSYDCH